MRAEKKYREGGKLAVVLFVTRGGIWEVDGEDAYALGGCG